jgi:hypothetical protein
MLRLPLLLAAAASLAACASGPPEIAWQPRPGANLTADRAECRRTADDVDINSPKQFTDGRYGVVAALAAKVDDDSLRGGTVARMRDAVFQDCMVRKGWTPK